MMKKLVLFLFVLFCGVAQSAQVVNVEYIHNAIKQKWDITVPYNPELTNSRVVANMKYLLTAVDVANKMLGTDTDFGDGEYATLVATDTVATDMAVDTLIKRSDYPFVITTTETNSFSFKISAAGTYIIDWGDGTIEEINKTDTTDTEYSHSYVNAKQHNIKIKGDSTAYNTSASTAAISFNGNKKLAGISGSLGAIFPTLDSGSQPRFYYTFAKTGITRIPSDLFNGIYGKPATYQFAHTFRETNIAQIPPELFSGLSDRPSAYLFNGTFYGTDMTSVPEKLFAGLLGKPANNMFDSTFANSKLADIPDGLFAGISGPPAAFMFSSTFYGTPVKSIPENLFAGISGAAAGSMFSKTFYGTRISSIPENLFAGITAGTVANAMFANTFYNCTYLSGPSARTNGQYLYEIWPNATTTYVGSMYRNATGLDDYDNIPSAWK